MARAEDQAKLANVAITDLYRSLRFPFAVLQAPLLRSAPLFTFTWKVILQCTLTASGLLPHPVRLLTASQFLTSLTLFWCIMHHRSPAAAGHAAAYALLPCKASGF